MLEKVDFGWKEAVNSMPVPCGILPPSNLDPSMSGGTRVYVCLPRAAMSKFKEEMKAHNSIKNA
ncbi:hypothetical protein JHK82_020695 [Glycine max]|nr:hypothetical protein JHK85_021140 [Glycine max]KAG5024791.1 hypothetical protein JHK86_020705 [Glycine max]KAG5135964.1 hypothetical protein JHK82_020695 [Glycine max]